METVFLESVTMYYLVGQSVSKIDKPILLVAFGEESVGSHTRTITDGSELPTTTTQNGRNDALIDTLELTMLSMENHLSITKKAKLPRYLSKVDQAT